MIFQKDQDDEYIGKIHLTNGFHGQLPNGTTIDMNNLRLKDMLALRQTDRRGDRLQLKRQRPSGAR